MAVVEKMRLRTMRDGWRARAWLRRGMLSPLVNRLARSPRGDVWLAAVLRNERPRLPFFLDYYRKLGIGHFLMVDNGSLDGSAAYLSEQPDVSVWHTSGSYRAARFGADWVNGLLAQHAVGRWVLTVDLDEFLVYPFCDARPVRALTDWLDAAAMRAFPAMLIDLYPKGPVAAARHVEGASPIEVAPWFDPGNYSFRRNPLFRNLWIQGGARARAFFADAPDLAPALNKIPLVRWEPGFVYASSTHMLLPRGLNLVYEEWGGEKASGALLHAKLLDLFPARAEEEVQRGEHYANSLEYRAYLAGNAAARSLWTPVSARFEGWRQLDELGLISTGHWA